MFECENQESCLLYLNGGQRNICKANNHDHDHDHDHDQTTDSQRIVRHSLNSGTMFVTAQAPNGD